MQTTDIVPGTPMLLNRAVASLEKMGTARLKHSVTFVMAQPTRIAIAGPGQQQLPPGHAMAKLVEGKLDTLGDVGEFILAIIKQELFPPQDFPLQLLIWMVDVGGFEVEDGDDE